MYRRTKITRLLWTGRVVSNTDISNRFLWDVRRTHATWWRIIIMAGYMNCVAVTE